MVAGLGLGALLAPAAVGGLGIRAALVLAGALLPLLVLGAACRLRRLGANLPGPSLHGAPAAA